MLFSIVLSIALPILMLASVSVSAATNDKNPEEKIDMKCYVSLHTGANSIVKASIRRKQISQLKTMISGRDMLTTLSDKRITVYKVYECVELADKFTSRKANKLDKETPM